MVAIATCFGTSHYLSQRRLWLAGSVFPYERRGGILDGDVIMLSWIVMNTTTSSYFELALVIIVLRLLTCLVVMCPELPMNAKFT
jgi:hypothetical protein